MEKNRITKKEVFGALINMVEGMDMVGAIPAEDVVTVLTTAIEQIDKKAAKAAETRAKKAAENDELIEKVFDVITEEPKTRDEVFAELDIEGLTVAKVGARLTKLVGAERIVKMPVKVENEEGKTLKRMAYALPSAVEESAE